MNNNPQVVSRIEGSGADPLTIPFSAGPGQMIVLPKFLWDTVRISHDNPLSEHTFFTNVVGASDTQRVLTNNEGAGRVPRGRIWVFTHLGITLHTPRKIIADAVLQDEWTEFLYKLRFTTILDVQIDKRTYLEVPVWPIFTNAFPTSSSNSPSYDAELFAPLMQRLPVKLYLREEVLWNVKLINFDDDGLRISSELEHKLGRIYLQIMFKGREYISVERP